MTQTNSISQAAEWERIQFYEEAGVDIRFLLSREFNLGIGTWGVMAGQARVDDGEEITYSFTVTINESSVNFFIAKEPDHPVLSWTDDLPYRRTPSQWRDWILHEIAIELKRHLDRYNHDQTLRSPSRT